MKSTYLSDWQAVKERFEQWWNRENTARPLMRIVAEGRRGTTAPPPPAPSPRELYLDAGAVVARYRHFCETHHFLADAYPSVSLDIGPGSMALYLGGEPEFSWDTVWFRECVDDCRQFADLAYDETNRWWVRHREMLRRAVALAEGDFFVNIPDIVENLDILAALRGPQDLCYDLVDEPEAVEEGVRRIDELYFRYYDQLYDLAKDGDGASSFTAFNVLGMGRTAKIQCDFCALISPQDFRRLVQPSLRKQAQRLDHSVYHLDGPDAIKHLDALMEIDELDALQWTCGAGQPDGGCEKWYPIYDRVREAGKSLWIMLEDGTPADWAESARRIVGRYGKEGIYLLFPVFRDPGAAGEMAALFD